MSALAWDSEIVVGARDNARARGFLRSAIDEGVDRLRHQCPQSTLGALRQPPSDLLGRPAFGQALNDEVAQAIVAFEDGRPLPSLKIGSVR